MNFLDWVAHGVSSHYFQRGQEVGQRQSKYANTSDHYKGTREWMEEGVISSQDDQ